MSSLSSQEKELIFNYCMGLVSDDQALKAQELMGSNPEAVQLYSGLKPCLESLENFEADNCPDVLAESTVTLLCEQAKSGYDNLELLLENEKDRAHIPSRFSWAALGTRLATAAVFMIVGAVLITAWNSATYYMRQIAWQNQCQSNLGGIYQGISNYKNDHDGKLASSASELGLPWWMVGNQQKNYSNTRPVWQLVKKGYIKPDQSLCPGHKHDRIPSLTSERIRRLNDFPSREYITYSFELLCRESNRMSTLPKVIMSDMNPLFEIIPSDFTGTIFIRLDDTLMTINSINHHRRGQNVLFCDGSIKFEKKRHIGIAQDDIFTLQNTTVYKGVEAPATDTDRFLAP
ncbi:MAG: hypothetical protein ACYTBP_06500 [Planctomycetota bacterium]|jgi:hypothetical protein